MVTVTGTGFAALAKNPELAKMAAFLSLISGVMAVFLTFVKMSAIFKKHLNREGTVANQFMPTYLIVIPILTLFGISIFRLGHYAEHVYHLPVLMVLAKIILLVLFAFQI
jgi:hypothetical protein